jgi:hypothetical protein
MWPIGSSLAELVLASRELEPGTQLEAKVGVPGPDPDTTELRTCVVS